jgi:hypothetical protein
MERRKKVEVMGSTEKEGKTKNINTIDTLGGRWLNINITTLLSSIIKQAETDAK